jgi:hypothetical protein
VFGAILWSNGKTKEAQSANHPTTWFPSGKPVLAWIEATLERVTMMVNMIMPI